MSLNTKRKIFVSAYACEPNSGSEPGVGWNWILQMSRFFEIWVLTRANNAPTIKMEIDKQKIENVHFVYHDPPKLILKMKKFIGTHFFYLFWQFGSNRLVKEYMIENDITIFHNLTFGNILLPISSYGRKNFFVWGPVGGGAVIPYSYTKKFQVRDRLKEFFRRIYVIIFRKFFLKAKLKDANLILCKDQMTMNLVPSVYRKKAILFTDVAVDNNLSVKPSFNDDKKDIRFISVGVLESFRGFDVLIDAFSLARSRTPNIKLEIVGDGYLKDKIKSIIAKKKLENSITLSGKISFADYHKKINECDVIINSCLKEGGVTLSFDSITYSKPLICIDTGGYTKSFKDISIVLPLISRWSLVDEMANEISKLTDQKYRENLISKLQGHEDKLSWEAKGDQIKELFMSLVS